MRPAYYRQRDGIVKSVPGLIQQWERAYGRYGPEKRSGSAARQDRDSRSIPRDRAPQASEPSLSRGGVYGLAALVTSFRPRPNITMPAARSTQDLYDR